MSTTQCHKCGVSAFETPLFRVNPKGLPGVFACEACMDTPPDADLSELTHIIVGHEVDDHA